ncbi:hypothetical protein KY363_00455 [Candidatus Woesearchaeota archaeon]|nr:hypothetical protein [Candidatus Woesearchaeota archaeon]
MNAFKEMVKRLNFFEKMLLIVGIGVTIVGFYFINKIYTGEGHLSWALLQAAFLWLLLLFMIILTDSNESIKEELKDVIKEHIEETKILKQISSEQLEELKVIKSSLKKTKPKRKR